MTVRPHLFLPATKTAARLRRPALLVIAVMTGIAAPVRADEFDDLRLRWVASLNGGPGLDTADPDIADELGDIAASAQSLWNSMDKSPDRTALWSDYSQLATLSSHITGSYNNLRRMATAFATPGNPLAGNTALRDDLFAALDWMYARWYNETKSEYYNWWDWQIGTPLALNDITALLYDHLSASQRANYMTAVNKFTPSPTMTGANLVWKATVVAVRGAIVKNSAKLTAARDSLGSVFAYVTSGDGFYTDGSFVQHTWHPYTGGYGSSLLANLGPLVQMLNGSTWQITDSRLPNLYRWIHDSFAPVLYRGALPDMLRGREIARSGSGDHGTGHSVIASVIRIAQFAPPEDAVAFKRMAKQWMIEDTSRDFIANTSLAVVPLARQILDDPAITPRGEQVAHHRFPEMDRVMHLRPGFGFGISMSSARIATYESINQENLKGWYTGDGMTYLYNGDLTHYNDNYWCTVNPYRLPGTTVDTVTRSNGSGQSTRPTQTWVGGTRLGEFGIAGMQLAAWSNGLAARKSWFLFDDEIVCLGADIKSTSGRKIETIVENRRLAGSGNQALLIDGTAVSTATDWTASLPAASWAHLAGNTAGSDIGYVFPQGGPLNGLREQRSGNWYAINNRSGSTTDHTRNYLTLWFDHGSNPAGATYSYAILPNMTSSAIASYASAPEFSILENTASAQTVRESTLGLTAANFWADATHASGGITCDRKASVMVQDDGMNLALSVADPTQANPGAIQVEIDTAVTGLLAADPRVTVIRTSPTVKVSVNVNGGAGAGFLATFTRAPGPNVPPAALDDNARAPAGTPVSIPVLNNDSDPDAGPSALGVTTVTAPAHGNAVVAGDSVIYTAHAGFEGVDSFRYTVSDGEDLAEAIVAVQVGPGPVAVRTLTASTWQDPNVPGNVLDGNLATRWSSEGIGQWLQCDLGTPHLVGSLALAFYQGNSRTATFDVQTSEDGTTWITRSTHTSSGTTNTLQTFPLTPLWTRWLRIVGRGNSQSAWNSYTELQVQALDNAAPVAPVVNLETDEGLPVSTDLSEAASDPDGGPASLTLVSLGTPSHGSVEVESGGIRYMPHPAFTGIDSFSYIVTDGALNATGQVQVAVNHVRTFAGFVRQSIGTIFAEDPVVAGPEADPDGDGARNLLEYALMLDPWHTDAATVVGKTDATAFRYTYTRRKLAADLIYQPELSDDLVDWRPAGAEVEERVLSETPTAQVVEVRDRTEPGTVPTRFHRLRVSLIP